MTFLHKILPPFKYEQGTFSVDITPDTRFTHLLLNLTAFRYLQEFPEIIKWCWENKCKKLEDRFKLFQECHKKFIGTKGVKYNNLGGHGLIYHYEWGDPTKEYNPITLAQFRSNLTQNKYKVQYYFR